MTVTLLGERGGQLGKRTTMGFAACDDLE